MSYKTITEEHQQSVKGNLIFRTKNQFIPNTVRGYVKGSEVKLKEVGKNILKIEDANVLEKDDIIIFEYSIEIISSFPDKDIGGELQKLKDEIISLKESQDILFEALQERVPLKTFNQWLSVMEKNFGKSILQGTKLMGIQGEDPTNR